MTYAYARVSARDQNLSRQLEAFAEMNIDRKHIFCDKKSGKDFDRTNYLRLVRKLRPGDLLVIKSIDRLGRNYQMIIDEWSRITKTIRRISSFWICPCSIPAPLPAPSSESSLPTLFCKSSRLSRKTNGKISAHGKRKA